MPLRRWWNSGAALAGATSTRLCMVDAQEWIQAAEDAAAAGGQLLALWAAAGAQAQTAVVRAALLIDSGLLVLEQYLPADSPSYRSLHTLFPSAVRMQRAAFDLCGVASNSPDQRPWLNHDAWSGTECPLRSDVSLPAAGASSHYPFVRVDGDGVHEIPVGPVHAGVIEPGHFRFSVVGEKVLRLEERLGYVHKGIEQRFTELPILTAHRLAARVSGDSAVAFSWAYCQALEGLSRCVVPRRAVWLRALCLELERIANHLGDLGALGNDAGFAFGLAQFSRLKETFLRSVDTAFGQRYLLDAVVPGGLRADLSADAGRALANQLRGIANEVRHLREIYDEHSGVRDRFAGAGQVAPELARRLGLIGFAGRASGQPFDARIDLPCPPYDELAPNRLVLQTGDVAARVALRFDEVQESCRLGQHIVQELPPGPYHIEVREPPPGAFGVGLIEGWRGPVLVALDAGPDGSIRRCHPHDPSWQNWPVLEHAIIGNIVPDFPLINKSFNLSYSGCDL